jgi:hypothetical protein
MIDYRVEVNANRLVLRLEQLPTVLRQRLKSKIGELTQELLRKVEAREPVRTGRLRRLTHAYVDENVAKNFVRGRVRVLRTRDHNTAGAAGALEYGSTGKRFAVRGYRSRGGQVSAYQRRGGIQAQRFLRGPAAIMIPRARLELQRVLQEVARDALK